MVEATSARGWARLPSAPRETENKQVASILGMRGERVATPATSLLSRRERDCLLWLAQGDRTKQISGRLGIAEATVSEYIDSARRKLGARTRPELVAKAILHGLITL